MEKKFSTHWTGSRQVRKQRKYRFNAPLHVRQKFMSANLSKDLRKKVGKRNIEIKKGDTVRVMRGKFTKKTGKVSGVDLKKTRLSVEGIQRQKKDGTKINVWFNPSKVQITEMVERPKKIKQVKQPQGEKNAPQKK